MFRTGSRNIHFAVYHFFRSLQDNLYVIPIFDVKLYTPFARLIMPDPEKVCASGGTPHYLSTGQQGLGPYDASRRSADIVEDVADRAPRLVGSSLKWRLLAVLKQARARDQRAAKW
jgi:hypothetical protein